MEAKPPNYLLTSDQYHQEILDQIGETGDLTPIKSAAAYGHAFAFYEMGLLSLDHLEDVRERLRLSPEETDLFPI